MDKMAVEIIVWKKGEDLYIGVPIGTIIKDSKTRKGSSRFIK